MPLPVRTYAVIAAGALALGLVLRSGMDHARHVIHAPVIEDLEINELAALMGAQGLPAEVRTGRRGAFVVSRAGDMVTQAHLYDCDAMRRCGSIMLRAMLGRSEAAMTTTNAWNRDKRFLKTFVDPDGDVFAEQDIGLQGGITKVAVSSAIRRFRSLVGEFHATREAARDKPPRPGILPPGHPALDRQI